MNDLSQFSDRFLTSEKRAHYNQSLGVGHGGECGGNLFGLRFKGV